MVSNFHSGRAGDLFIVLQVDEKRGIQREGLNLYSKISIDFTDAILGAVTKVVYKLVCCLTLLDSENLVGMTSLFFRWKRLREQWIFGFHLELSQVTL